MVYIRYQRIQKLKKFLDMLVYGSTVIDVFIMSVIFLSYFKLMDPMIILVELNTLLTLIVLMTIAIGALLVTLKHYDKVLRAALGAQYKVKSVVVKISNRPVHYKYRPWVVALARVGSQLLKSSAVALEKGAKSLAKVPKLLAQLVL